MTITAETDGFDATRYRDDPVAYAWDRHGIWLWGKLANAARALAVRPYRVLIKSANGIGKTYTAAVLLAWFHESFRPGEGVITGPRLESIKDSTFKEFRKLMKDHPGLLPRAPRLHAADDHYVKATTATTGDAFQGIHSENILLVFEEAMGVVAQFWEAAKGIRAGGDRAFWLAIHNPTNSNGPAFQEEQSGRWAVFGVSAFEHPNIAAELLGRPAPMPGAVRLAQLLENLEDFGDSACKWPVGTEVEATDVDLWDSGTYGANEDGQVEVARGEFVDVAEVIEAAKQTFPGQHWRPNPIGEARVCGRYPRAAINAIFSEATFQATLKRVPDALPTVKVTIGCDVARYGDDKTAIHVRRGRKSLRHLTYHGQNTAHTAAELKRLCREFAPLCKTKPELIPCIIDDTGVGGGVTDQADGFNFIGVNAQQTARHDDEYPDARSEMIFDLAKSMAEGDVSLAEIESDTQDELKRQGIGITYELDRKGRRAAESTKSIKKRLGRSPDDLVSVALAYYEPRIPTLGGARAVFEPGSLRTAAGGGPGGGGGTSGLGTFGGRPAEQRERLGEGVGGDRERPAGSLAAEFGSVPPRQLVSMEDEPFARRGRSERFGRR